MSPGKLIVKTANVSISITTTAMLQSHQSRCSSFWSFSCSSYRRAPEDGLGWSMGDVDGDKFMAGRESRSKSEIRYTIINPMEKVDGRIMCAAYRNGHCTLVQFTVQSLQPLQGRAGGPGFG